MRHICLILCFWNYRSDESISRPCAVIQDFHSLFEMRFVDEGSRENLLVNVGYSIERLSILLELAIDDDEELPPFMVVLNR